MATSPALVQALVAATAEDKVSVQVTLRRLRQARLIPVGGRGAFAIPMDFKSAMRLLIAVCASIPLETDAAKKAVRRFEGLLGGCRTSATVSSLDHVDQTVLALDELADEHTLGEALIKLLTAGARDELFVFATGDTRHLGFRRAALRGFLRVSFFLPLPMARIEHQIGAVIKKIWTYGPSIAEDTYISVLRDKHLGGRKRSVEIDEVLFELVGAAIAS